MRNHLVVTLLTLGLTVGPAFAESVGNAGSDKNTSANVATPNPSAGSTSTSNGMQMPAALKQSLQQAGFKDIQIGATSYVVHAKGPDGAPVVMMVTPDSVTGVITNPQSAQLPDTTSDQPQNKPPQQENGTSGKDPGSR